MSARPLLLAAAALAALGLACGDGGGTDVPDDPRVREVGFLAEEATYAYAGGGPEALYDFLAPDLTQRCSRQRFAQILGEEEKPTAFGVLKSAGIEDEKVRITFTVAVGDRTREVEWTFVRGPQDAWYIADLAGAEECTG